MDRGNQDRKAGGFFGSRANIVLIGFLVVGGFYLIAEHRVHLLSWWPLLFLAACPLMHLFMHHDHGGHNDSEDAGDTAADRRENTPPHHH